MRTIIALALIAGGGWQMFVVLANKVPAWEANLLGGKAVGSSGSGQTGSGGGGGGSNNGGSTTTGTNPITKGPGPTGVTP